MTVMLNLENIFTSFFILFYSFHYKAPELNLIFISFFVAVDDIIPLDKTQSFFNIFFPCSGIMDISKTYHYNSKVHL